MLWGRAALAERAINQTRSQYQAVARRATVLYFCVADLAAVEPLYHYGINWFVQIYRATLDDAQDFEVADFERRIVYLQEKITGVLCGPAPPRARGDAPHDGRGEHGRDVAATVGLDF